MAKGIRKKGASLSLRLFIVVIILCTVPVVVTSYFLVRSSSDKEIEFYVQRSREQVMILANQLQTADYINVPTNPTVNYMLAQVADIWDARIQIMDAGCRIISDSYNVDQGRYNVSEQVMECLSAKSIISKADRETMLSIVAYPMVNETSEEKAITGVVLVTKDLSSAVSGIRYIQERIPLYWLIMFAATVLAAVLAILFLLRPLKKLAVSVDAAADGSLRSRVDVRNYRETARISDAVNRTIGRLRMLDESRQEFVSDVAHELKTPITSVKVLAESLMGMEEVPNELYREFMADITKEIDRESRIIDDLLSMVRLDRGVVTLNIANTNINDWLQLTLKRLMPLAQNAKVELAYESFRPVMADVDEVKMTLAITNLVENAIKYNREGGWVRVSLNADMKYFYIKVADSGCGIPEEAQDHIFERFYRVDKDRARATGGTGLGLSITKSIVNLHNGAIRVHSSTDEGSTFVVRIPLVYTSEEGGGKA